MLGGAIDGDRGWPAARPILLAGVVNLPRRRATSHGYEGDRSRRTTGRLVGTSSLTADTLSAPARCSLRQ